jgi:hypothetical protein
MKGITQILQGKQYSKVRKPIDLEQFAQPNVDEFNKQSKILNRVLILIALSVFGAFAVRIFIS